MSHDWPASGWVGLSVGGLELAGNAYARLPADFVAIAADQMTATNVAGMQWPTAYPFAWGDIDGVQVWDSASGGALLLTVPVMPALTVNAWDTPRIPSGGLVIIETIEGTPYGRGRYGRGRYATRHVLSGEVLLEITFRRYDPCQGGAWTPAEPCEAGSWATLDPCTIGAWNPAQSPLRRVA